MTDWNEAERRVERAQELFEQHKWQEALEELRAATAINPYNSGWHFNIGLTLDEMGRLEEAIEAYRQALSIEPHDLQALFHLGVDLHRIGRYGDAIGAFDQVQELDAAFEPSYCQRIMAYTQLGDHEQAEEMFYLARLYKDHCPHCYYSIGCSLYDRRKYDKAIYCFQKTIDLDEQHPDVHLRLAEAFWSKGDLEQARWHYLAGLRQDPGNTQALLDLGELLLDMGRNDEAGEKFRRAIELAPDSPAGHYFFACWLQDHNRLDEAAESFRKTLRMDPTFPGAHLRLAQIGLRQGQEVEARTHVRAELVLRPEDPRLLLDLANLLMDTGEPRLAVACLKRLTHAEPDNASAWVNLAVAQFQRGKYHDGIGACETALECDPRNLLAIYNLALAHEHLHQYDQALRFTYEGLCIAPGDPSLQRLEFRVKVLRFRDQILRTVQRLFRW